MMNHNIQDKTNTKIKIKSIINNILIKLIRNKKIK
jgi:hypothetical protein